MNTARSASARRLVQAERIVRKIGAGLALPEALTMAGAAAMHRKSGKIEAGQTLRPERFLRTVGNGSAVPIRPAAEGDHARFHSLIPRFRSEFARCIHQRGQGAQRSRFTAQDAAAERADLQAGPLRLLHLAALQTALRPPSAGPPCGTARTRWRRGMCAAPRSHKSRRQAPPAQPAAAPPHTTAAPAPAGCGRARTALRLRRRSSASARAFCK